MSWKTSTRSTRVYASKSPSSPTRSASRCWGWCKNLKLIRRKLPSLRISTFSLTSSWSVLLRRKGRRGRWPEVRRAITHSSSAIPRRTRSRSCLSWRIRTRIISLRIIWWNCLIHQQSMIWSKAFFQKTQPTPKRRRPPSFSRRWSRTQLLTSTSIRFKTSSRKWTWCPLQRTATAKKITSDRLQNHPRRDRTYLLQYSYL